VGDAYFCMDGAVAAYVRAGMRAVTCQGLIGFPAPGVPDPSQGLTVCREFVERWQTAGPLITPGIFVHSIYSCPEETIKQAVAMSAELGCPLFVHLAETKQEAAQSLLDNDATPAEWLEKLGILERFSAVIHGAWLTRPEMEMLVRHGVGLVLCPESNMKLASGMADHHALLECGVTLGLGTDGVASNNDLDMIGEMSTLAKAAKVHAGNPALMTAAQVLGLATAGSAACLGLGGEVGQLKPGQAGDLIVVDLKAPHLTPIYNFASHMVYAARRDDVRHVVVSGRQVVGDRRVLSFDLDSVLAEVRELAGRVAAERG
jgi:5-methylthioadenosine/S-adenosylhomocysteine deaminase